MAQLAHQFDLNRLQGFLAVAEEGSITAAAARLSVAQPALSASIRRLEADLGVALFERQARGVALTPAGRGLLPQVYEVFGILGSLRSELKQIAEEPAGEISIGLPPSTAAVLTRPLLRRLTEQYPKISLRLVEAMSGYLHDWISTGDLDIAITFRESDTEAVISQPLLKEEMVLIGAADAMNDIPDPFPFTRLADLPLIVTSSRHSLRSNLEQRMEALGRTMNVRFEIDAGHQLVRLVSSGEGYGVFARSAFVEELAAGRVRAVSLSPDYIRTVCLSYHRRKKAEQVFGRIIASIETLVSEIAGTEQWPTSRQN